MSIEITYKEVNSLKFNSKIQALAREKDFGSFKASYNMAKFVRKYNQEADIARELFSNWSKEYIKKDENGKPLSLTADISENIIDDKKEEFSTKFSQFLETPVTIEVNKFTSEDMGSIKLSPDDLLVLAPIFDFQA